MLNSNDDSNNENIIGIHSNNKEKMLDDNTFNLQNNQKIDIKDFKYTHIEVKKL
jgi:hypothetical protein